MRRITSVLALSLLSVLGTGCGEYYRLTVEFLKGDGKPKVQVENVTTFDWEQGGTPRFSSRQRTLQCLEK